MDCKMKKYIFSVFALFLAGCISCPVEMISKVNNLSAREITVKTDNGSQIIEPNAVCNINCENFVLLANAVKFNIDVLDYIPSDKQWGFFSESTWGYYQSVVFEFEYTKEGELYILGPDKRRIAIQNVHSSNDSSD
ncbi:MAG: hypothetical protein VB042_09880 [Victivallaceae bacterium]|nr:hypothetical protein [Victivallaceae bacterium]